MEPRMKSNRKEVDAFGQLLRTKRKKLISDVLAETSGSRNKIIMRGWRSSEWTYNWHHKESARLSCHANWRFKLNRKNKSLNAIMFFVFIRLFHTICKTAQFSLRNKIRIFRLKVSRCAERFNLLTC